MGTEGLTRETGIPVLHKKPQQFTYSFGENTEGYYLGFHMQDAPVNLGCSSCEYDDPEVPSQGQLSSGSWSWHGGRTDQGLCQARPRAGEDPGRGTAGRQACFCLPGDRSHRSIPHWEVERPACANTVTLWPTYSTADLLAVVKKSALCEGTQV